MNRRMNDTLPYPYSNAFSARPCRPAEECKEKNESPADGRPATKPQPCRPADNVRPVSKKHPPTAKNSGISSAVIILFILLCFCPCEC